MIKYKYKLYRFAILIVLCAVANYSCKNINKNTTPDSSDWPHAVSYEIFVYSFADGSGDGIGDFKGLTSKLDYLKDLGVKSLWLMPINPSPKSIAGYRVEDYKAISPNYGTMEDFKHFLSEAHTRDIRVIIDLVINHSGRDHPWFQNALADTTSPYFDFYIWANDDEIDNMENPDRWYSVDEFDKHFYAYFNENIPDLNHDNPAVRDSVYNIGRYWLEDIGVDGFRLDAARHIFPEDRVEDIYVFWEDFRAKMEAVNQNVLLVGEVWSDFETVKPYLSGFSSLFNFEMSDAIMEAAKTGYGAELADKHTEIHDAYRSVSDDFVDATFLTNHDKDRVMTVLDNASKARLTASLLLTLPGAPYIYYGQEIGMRGTRHPNSINRGTMYWNNDSDDIRTRWIDLGYGSDEIVIPVEDQLKDKNSLLHHYKRLIELRNSEPVLTFGGIDPIDSSYEELVIFRRTYHDDSLLVVHNVSDKPIVKSIPGSIQAYDGFIYQSHDAIELTGSTLTLPAQSSAVLYQSRE